MQGAAGPISGNSQFKQQKLKLNHQLFDLQFVAKSAN